MPTILAELVNNLLDEPVILAPVYLAETAYFPCEFQAFTAQFGRQSLAKGG